VVKEGRGRGCGQEGREEPHRSNFRGVTQSADGQSYRDGQEYGITLLPPQPRLSYCFFARRAYLGKEKLQWVVSSAACPNLGRGVAVSVSKP
jgi:hypothetical protein